ncbi:alpha amylase [Acaromyces ingoldii]|uniref:Alpha amylase n=1 Tax=Acaromyces ingoldii TaxID=215250 RepID=A0A316YGZ8_9BASI|nr:alpha amylase [Acaromyces ingoldii]PWN88421.1 alpha amylase [Acaromyces ingoldii]
MSTTNISEIPRADELLTTKEFDQLPNTFSEPAWWKEAVIFQIWPASFCDSNGDGIGDLGGVLSKVDYLKEVGADVIWLSPIYESPDKDMGYDVADYKKIADRYGSLEDVDKLISELKKRGMKLMMDLVVNHTSDQHAWFKQSRSSKDNDKRDWYIWRPAKRDERGNRVPPNNWVSFFGGSAWCWDETTQEYFLCLFTKEQPDLNWENEEVREAVYDIMRFWLDRGCAGFRMDVINEVSKTYVEDPSDPKRPALPDAPISDPNATYQAAHMLFCNGPRIHEFMREMHEKVLQHYDTITVGETPHAKHPSIVLPWVNPHSHELRMCFTFDLHDVDGDQQWPLIPRPFDLVTFKSIVNKWQAFFSAHNGWHANYLENHDQARSVSRWLSDAPEHRKQAAKLVAMMQTSFSGSLYLYQGQELGMKNIPKEWPIDDYLDVATINFYNECKDRTIKGLSSPATPEQVHEWAALKARDNARTPVQWNSSPASAGFSPDGARTKPWMRVQVEDAQQGWNATDEAQDPLSVLNFWKRALKLRKEVGGGLMVRGNFWIVKPEDPNVFAYVRNLGHEVSVLVVLNFSKDEQTVRLDGQTVNKSQQDGKLVGEFKGNGPCKTLEKLRSRVTILLHNYADIDGSRDQEVKWVDDESFVLRAFEGVWFKID